MNLNLPNPSLRQVMASASTFVAKGPAHSTAWVESLMKERPGMGAWVRHVLYNGGVSNCADVINTLALLDEALGASEETRAIEQTALHGALQDIVAAWSGKAGDGYARIPVSLIENAADLIGWRKES